MSSSLRLTIEDYERMIANGAFVGIERRLELIHGEIREMNPAGPYHYDYITYLTRWATSNVSADEATVQIQSAILLGDSMPEPDVMLLRPKRYGGQRPRGQDAFLIIEVSDSSLNYDLGEKAMLYSQADITEYWVVDALSQKVHQHRSPLPDGYRDIQVFCQPEKLKPLFKSDIELSLEELFCDEA